MGKTDIMRQCDLFSGFTDVGLTIIASIAEEKRLRAGTPIFVEGMVGESLYILESGEVSVIMRDESGSEREVAEIRPFEAFGELALLGGGTRLTSAKTRSDSVLLEIQLKDFSRLQRKKPQACLKLLMAIVHSFGQRLGQDRETWRRILLSATNA